MSAGTGTPLDVAMLTPCFWPEVRRGSERVVAELATQLMARGHRIRLIAGHRGPPRRSTEYGLDIQRVPRFGDGYLRRRMIQEYLTHLPASYLALTLEDFDVAYACFPTDAVVAARWGRRSGRVSVFSYNGIPQRNVIASHRLRLRLLTEALADSTAIVVPSEASARGMDRWFGVESTVIHPGVDCETFQPGEGRADVPTIICAAPYADGRKRVQLLVDAFRIVRRERPDARLLLLAPEDPAIARRLEEEEGLELFAPREQPADLAPLYREAWVSALASYNEAFGLVLVEAQACGTPAVTGDDGGGPEIVDGPLLGRLFSGDQPESVARALLEALELQADAGTAAACRESALRFSSARCSEAHERLFHELGAGAR